jgi:outer membrane protein TolC
MVRTRRLVPAVQPEKLDRLVHTALERNPNLEAARHGLLAAQYKAQGGRWCAPAAARLTGQIGRAHINGSYLYGPTNAIDQAATLRHRADLAYNPDVFGATGGR